MWLCHARRMDHLWRKGSVGVFVQGGGSDMKERWRRRAGDCIFIDEPGLYHFTLK